ncbi:fatty acyl-CoA reductase 1-like [Haliotis rufescens]|uniref:fatty acyl-CoA reductase 1-like n=1 Tax=Haliotis rufescens TaxID=6454 RepID=UPI001EAFBB93|nr:fatty acyl-CoA reductase 1-like [Haliotis rufescens]XP_048241737.1 fatty acyl-CoA reductase 1-like [Haliotis rufescens]
MDIQQSSNIPTESVDPDSTEIKMDDHTELCVGDYYKGRKIFVTGASGFVGKVLIEKLLRSCPEIDKIYILMRPKKSQDIHQRTEDLIKSKLFDKLRKLLPHFDQKIHPVQGDISLPNVGLSPSDTALLVDGVDIIFHSAATVRFDEPLRLSTEMNVVGVRKMIELAKKLKHLQVFVHVSTAYANCDRPYIEETVYPTLVQPQKLIDALEWMDDEMVDIVTPKLLGNKPNTYTYTKQLGETLLVTEGAGLPIAIVRPSIVGAAWKEPLPGWIDNYNGPSGLYIAAGKGILRSMKGDHSAVADIIPVDIPVNLMITSAWYTAVYQPKQTMVYHCTTGSVNPFTWGEMESVVINFYKRTPLDDCFRRPNVALTNNSFLHDYWMFVSHMVPAYMYDLVFKLVGKQPRMVKTYNKLHRSMDILTYFTSNSWEWTYTNLDMLKSKLTAQDFKTFYFDPRPLHWPTYIENYCLGAKQYLLNEDLAGLPAARAHLRKLRNIRYMFNTVTAIVFWRLLIARSDIARNVWYLIVSLVFKFVRFFRITSTMQKT